MGIKVFTSSKGDDLFFGVKLPQGWKTEATYHSMWNNLVDNNGAIRATFFYKAAFYDRDSFINFNTRYERENEYAAQKDENGTFPRLCKVIDRRTKEVLFKTEMGGFDDSDKQYAACEQYLNEHFPEWRDIHAYWND